MIRQHRRAAEATLPTTPTDALPGTEAKVRVMAERAALGLELFHPDDARRDDPPPIAEATPGYEPGGVCGEEQLVGCRDLARLAGVSVAAMRARLQRAARRGLPCPDAPGRGRAALWRISTLRPWLTRLLRVSPAVSPAA